MNRKLQGVDVVLMLEAVRSRVRRALIARSPGIDLTRLDRVPERLTWPLKREGMEPDARLAETSARPRARWPRSSRSSAPRCGW